MLNVVIAVPGVAETVVLADAIAAYDSDVVVAVAAEDCDAEVEVEVEVPGAKETVVLEDMVVVPQVLVLEDMGVASEISVVNGCGIVPQGAF